MGAQSRASTVIGHLRGFRASDFDASSRSCQRFGLVGDPGVGAKHTGRATNQPWPGKTLVSHRLKTLPAAETSGRPISWISCLLLSQPHSRMIRRYSAIFAPDCKFLVGFCLRVNFNYIQGFTPSVWMNVTAVRCSPQTRCFSVKIKSSFCG